MEVIHTLGLWLIEVIFTYLRSLDYGGNFYIPEVFRLWV